MFAKKTCYMGLTVLFLAGIAGCGQAASGTANAETTLTEEYADAIPVESQLIVGTFALEETEWAVDADMAQKLLPLWKTLQSLENSDAAAAEEITAVLQQIQETMLPDQIKAIRAMQLTQESLQEILQQMGGSVFGNRGDFNSRGTPPAEGQGFQRGVPPEGFVPGEGMGPGMGGGNGGPVFIEGGEDISEEQIATLRAGRSQNGQGGALAGLVGALIRFLEEKVNPPAAETPPAP